MHRVIALAALLMLAACDPAEDPAASKDASVSADGAKDASGKTGDATKVDGSKDAADASLRDASVALDSGESLDALRELPGPADVTADELAEIELPELPEGACDETAEVVVRFPTEDGETLEADFFSTGVPYGPVAILLHMIPPANDRTNYPADFRKLLVSRGISVLNVDRRGAGGSTGKAADAYTGPAGKLDARGALSFLSKTSCPIDMKRVALVGASNGTTTVLDFTVDAAANPKLPPPAALVYLTGGTYTENQTSVAKNLKLLSAVPTLFVYSDKESAWSAQFEALGTAAWRFEEYSPGGHGTQMFGVQPTSASVVADWLVSQF